jgi:hypothetical protein
MAFDKITAGGATTVPSGQTVSFITEEEGSIVLLPGFKAEYGSKFTTQRKDLSGSSRICGSICRIEYLLYEHSPGESPLIMYNLFNAVEIDYKIFEFATGRKVCEKTLNISSNGNFNLWDCITGTSNLEGTVLFYIVYDVLYCNGASYGDTYHFQVYYRPSKSSNEESDEPEEPDTFLSPPNNIPFQDEIAPPSFTIIPNPNLGTFQIEANFTLTDIANLKIINPMGIPVYETQNLSSNTIQLPNSASGQHFVIVILKNGTVLTQKMMLRR